MADQNHNLKRDQKKEREEAGISYRYRYLTEETAVLSEKYGHEAGGAAMDIYENGDLIFVEIELAGVNPDDIAVSVDMDKLIIEGAKSDTVTREKNVVFHCAERSFGKFRRIFVIGSAIDSRKIEARYKSGVLLLKLPKVQDRRNKLHRIKVQVDD